jgi:hypothetical protein
LAESKNQEPAVQDRSIFYTDLAYIEPKFKNELFFAQMIYFAKKNAKLFLDPKRAAAYRATDKLELHAPTYKQMVDPITPMGAGGTAQYFNSDFKANPIYLHLKNIVKAEIQRMSKQLEVNCTDKYAKTRRQKENYKILKQGLFRNIINVLAADIGMEGISDSQDPYKWMQKFVEKQQGDQAEQETGQEQPQKEGSPSDIVESFLDLIKTQIQDEQDLALYNEYIYKGDYEIAFEKGIDYFLINRNKWAERWEDEYIDDIMHFYKACGEWYTDQVTGYPVVERFVPEKLWVSPFKRKDGEDLMYYFIEYEITFADFVKTMGSKLDPEQLKAVFNYNKTQGSAHGFNWVDIDGRIDRQRDNAYIRVGKFACLTQNYDVFMDDVQAKTYNTSDLSWYPTKEESETKIRDEKHYNVWYSCYYIPPTTNSLSNADYAWQAQFIFDIKKNQDQFRYGDDGRYSKSPMVIYDNSTQATFTDITQEFMPKIHHAWHKYQNCLINDIDAIALSDEFLGSLLSAIDEDNKINPANPNEATGGNGRDAAMEQWKMIKQGNIGFLKMTDKNGKLIADPSKFVIPIKNGQLERAERYMMEMLSLYNMMSQSLARSPISSGEEVKPRTPVAALQESIKSSDNAIWGVQKGYEAFLKMYGERIIQHIITIAQEKKEYGYTKRWDDFVSTVGLANATMIEGMEDIPPETVGMTVNYVDNTSKKEFVMQLAVEYMKRGQLDEDFLYLIMGIDNWKYSMCLLRMGIKRRKKEAQAEAAQQQQYIMEQKQADLQIAMALQGGKTQGKVQEIQAEGQTDAALNEQSNAMKADTMRQQKEQLLKNKLTENLQKSDLKKQEEQQKPFTIAG